MIHSVKLTNFRRHADLYVELGEGLNIVCGPNWAGKSTVLSAILYGLFGARAAHGSAENLIKRGEKTMEVQVRFSIGGDGYMVTRGPKKAQLIHHAMEKPIATGQGPVTAEIESLAGMSAKDFTSYCSTKQEEAASLLTLSSAKLGEYVANLTGMNVIDEVLERGKKLGYELDGRLSALPEADVEALRAATKEWSGVHNRAVAAMELQRVSMEAQSEAMQEAAAATVVQQLSYTAAENSRRAYAVADGVVKNATELLSAAELAMPPQPKDDLATAEAHLAELEEQRKDWEAWTEQVDYLKTQIPEAEEAVAAYAAAIADKPSPAVDSFQIVVDARSDREVAKAAVEMANKALADSSCPYCQRPFEDSKDEASLIAAVEAADASLLNAEILLQELEEAHRGNIDLQTELERLSADMARWNEYLADMRDKQQSLIGQDRVEPIEEAVLNGLRGKASVLRREWEYHAQAAAVLKQRDKDVEAATARRDSVILVGGASKADMLKAEQKESELNAAYQETAVEHQKMAVVAAQSGTMKTNYEAQLAEGEKARETRQQALTSKEHLKELTKFLRDNRDRFTQAVWQQLLGAASEFIREATSGDVTELTRSQEGEFEYVENGERASVEHDASGMQKAIFSTAVKMALAGALENKLGVLFLDEVTAAARGDTSLTFTSILARTGQQILLVTHRQEDAAVAGQLIELS